MKDFEFIEHTADLKIRVYGKTIESLFINALKGMFQSIHPNAPQCSILHDRLLCPSLPISHRVLISSYDKETLLVDFLSEALYLCDTHNEAYLDATINALNHATLNATIFGIAIEGFQLEIKAVTYHDLKIEYIKGKWQTDIVFDI